MKKSFLLVLLAGMFMMTISSCRTTQKAVAVAPINVQVNFTMDDLVYIGDVTGTSNQSYVLGIPMGGRKFHSGVLLSSSFGLPIPPSRGYSNALYDALTQMPDADFVLPVSYDTETDQMFMGRRENLTLRCKAYKIKSK